MGEHPGPEIERRSLLKNATIYSLFALAANRYIRNDEASGDIDATPSLPKTKDNDIFPEILPPAIAGMQHAAVAISVDIKPSPILISGTIIDPTHVLTAGHGFRADTGELLPFVGCLGDITIHGRDLTGEIIHGNSARVVSLFNLDKPSIPDISLIETQEPLGTSYTLPRVTLYNQHVTNNTPLYFINYQPTQSWGLRDPSSDNPELYPPAIYGGRAFATWNGNIVAQLNEKNYGDGAPDTTLRVGGSGGSVFTKNGLYIGPSNRYNFGGKEAFIQPIPSPFLASLFHEIRYNPDACIR